MFYFSVAVLCIIPTILLLPKFRQGDVWLGYPEPCQNMQGRTEGHGPRYQPALVLAEPSRGVSQGSWQMTMGSHALWHCAWVVWADGHLTSCGRVSFPKASLLIAHLKQSRRLCDRFSQSWHTVLTPALMSGLLQKKHLPCSVPFPSI